MRPRHHRLEPVQRQRRPAVRHLMRAGVQDKLECRARRALGPAPPPEPRIGGELVGVQAGTAVDAPQELQPLEDVALLQPGAQHPPLERHGPIAPAMRVQELDQPGAAAGQRLPEAAGHRRVGGELGRRLAGEIPDQRPADREARQQHPLPVDVEPRQGILQHLPHERQLVAQGRPHSERPAPAGPARSREPDGCQDDIATRHHRPDQRGIADHRRPPRRTRWPAHDPVQPGARTMSRRAGES